MAERSSFLDDTEQLLGDTAETTAGQTPQIPANPPARPETAEDSLGPSLSDALDPATDARIMRDAERFRQERETEANDERARSEASGFAAALKTFTDTVSDGQWWLEFPKAVPEGVAQAAGMATMGPPTVATNAQLGYRQALRRQLDTYDKIDNNQPFDGNADPTGYRWGTPEEKAAERRRIQALLDESVVTPIQDRPLYQLGQQIIERGKKILPAAPGYEQSISRQLGSGIGTMLFGLPFGFFGSLPAGITFASMGVGEATQRAVEYDQAERKAGRAGLTPEQIATAGILGTAPGLTDLLPLETLLGRLPVPIPQTLRRPLAKAIGRIGGQAFVEGVQEGGQEFLQNLITREIYNSNQDLMHDVLPSSALGAGVGGVAETGKIIGHGAIKLARRGGRSHGGQNDTITDVPPTEDGVQPTSPGQPPNPSDQGTLPAAEAGPASPQPGPRPEDPYNIDTMLDPPVAPPPAPEAVEPSLDAGLAESLGVVDPFADDESLDEVGTQLGTQTDTQPDNDPVANPATPEQSPVVEPGNQPDIQPDIQLDPEEERIFTEQVQAFYEDQGLAVDLEPEAMRDVVRIMASEQLDPEQALDRYQEELEHREIESRSLTERLAEVQATPAVETAADPAELERAQTFARERGLDETEFMSHLGRGREAAEHGFAQSYEQERVRRGAPETIGIARQNAAAAPGVATPAATGSGLTVQQSADAGLGGGLDAGPGSAILTGIPGIAPAGSVAQGVLPNGPGAADLGRLGAQPAGAPAAAQLGGPGRVFEQQPQQPRQSKRERTAVQERGFRELLNGRLPYRQWLSRMREQNPDITPQEFEKLIGDAILRDELRIDGHGNIVRTPNAQRAQQLVDADILPPMISSVEQAIDNWAMQSGRHPTAEVVALAQDADDLRGTDRFDEFLEAVEEAELSREDAIDLAAIAGYPVSLNARRANALKTLEQRHQDLIDYNKSIAMPRAESDPTEVANAQQFVKEAAELGKRFSVDNILSTPLPGTPEEAMALGADILGHVFDVVDAQSEIDFNKLDRASLEAVQKSLGELWPVLDALRSLDQIRKLLGADTITQDNTIEAVSKRLNKAADAITERSDEIIDILDVADSGGEILMAVKRGFDQRMELDALGFYSGALEAARKLKQAKGTPEQMRAQLRSAGVKEAELAAVKLDAFLEGKKSVTRDEIISLLENNRVEVRESVYGANLEADRRAQAADDLALRRFKGYYDGLTPAQKAEIDAAVGPQIEVLDHKWSSYSLDPSNPTYRETVLHLPPSNSANAAAMRAEADSLRQAALAEHARMTASGEIRLPQDHPAVQNLARMTRQADAAGWNADNAVLKHNFTSGHWSEPNIIAHVRTSLQRDADGKVVFLIDELQSDWGQKLREGGVRDEARIAAMERRIEEAKAALDNPEHLNEARYHLGRAAEGFDGTELAYAMAQRVREGDEVARDWHFKHEGLTNDFRIAMAEAATAKASTPGHPLVNTTDQWVTTALRRMIAQAVAAGADKIAFTPGKVQNDRFNLATYVSDIAWGETGPGTNHGYLSIRRPGEEQWSTLAQGVPRENVADYVGKEMAERLLAQSVTEDPRNGFRQAHVLTDIGEHEIGGEGMRATYDSIYPRTLLKILQKMDKGVKQGKESLTSSVDGRTFHFGDETPSGRAPIAVSAQEPIQFHTFPITQAVRDSVGQGQALFSIAKRQQDAKNAAEGDSDGSRNSERRAAQQSYRSRIARILSSITGRSRDSAGQRSEAEGADVPGAESRDAGAGAGSSEQGRAAERAASDRRARALLADIGITGSDSKQIDKVAELVEAALEKRGITLHEQNLAWEALVRHIELEKRSGNDLMEPKVAASIAAFPIATSLVGAYGMARGHASGQAILFMNAAIGYGLIKNHAVDTYRIWKRLRAARGREQEMLRQTLKDALGNNFGKTDTTGTASEPGAQPPQPSLPEGVTPTQDGGSLFSIMHGSDGESDFPSGMTLEEMEKIADAVMESPEYKASLAKPVGDGTHGPSPLITNKQPGYMTEAWKAARVYQDPENKNARIEGFDALVDLLARRMRNLVHQGGPIGPMKTYRAFLLMGYPGAGKSTVAHAIRAHQFAVHVVSDDVRHYIPEYLGGKNLEGTKVEAGDLAAAVADKIASTGEALVIETIGSVNGTADRAARLRDAGYHITMVNIETHRAIAKWQAVSRWRGAVGRAVPKTVYSQGKDLTATYEEIKRRGDIADEYHWIARRPDGSGAFDTIEQASVLADFDRELQAAVAETLAEKRAQKSQAVAGDLGQDGRSGGRRRFRSLEESAVAAGKITSGPVGPTELDRNARPKRKGDKDGGLFAISRRNESAADSSGRRPHFPERGFASPIKDWEEAINLHLRLERRRGNWNANPVAWHTIVSVTAMANAFVAAEAVQNQDALSIIGAVGLAANTLNISQDHIRDIIRIRRNLKEMRARNPELVAGDRVLTREAAAALPVTFDGARAELEKMVPADVAVRMRDRLIDQNGGEANAWYKIRTKLIEVSMVNAPLVAKVRGFHEVVHALREWGRPGNGLYGTLFDAKEWAALVERAKKLGVDAQITFEDGSSALQWYRDSYTYMLATNGYQGDIAARVEELIDQERVAKLAEMWAEGSDFGTKVNTLLERIALLIQAVHNFMRGNGFTTAEQIFADMAAGNIARRAGIGLASSKRDSYAQLTPAQRALASPHGQAALRAARRNNALTNIDNDPTQTLMAINAKGRRIGATGTAAQWINRNERAVSDWQTAFREGLDYVKAIARTRFADATTEEALDDIEAAPNLGDYLRRQRANPGQLDPNVQQALAVFDANPERAIATINGHIGAERRRILNEWKHYLTETNEGYAADPFWLDYVWQGLVKPLRNDSPDLPPPLNAAVLADLHAAIEEDPDNRPFHTVYAEYAAQNALDEIDDDNRLDLAGDKAWVKVPQTAREHPDYQKNVDLIKNLSCKTWCTSGALANQYITTGDFWMLTEGDQTRMAIRFTGDKVSEIQGPANNGTIPAAYAADVTALVDSGEIALSEHHKSKLREASERATKLADVDKAASEGRIIDAFRMLGVEAHPYEGGVSVEGAMFDRPNQTRIPLSDLASATRTKMTAAVTELTPLNENVADYDLAPHGPFPNLVRLNATLVLTGRAWGEVGDGRINASVMFPRLRDLPMGVGSWGDAKQIQGLRALRRARGGRFVRLAMPAGTGETSKGFLVRGPDGADYNVKVNWSRVVKLNGALHEQPWRLRPGLRRVLGATGEAGFRGQPLVAPGASIYHDYSVGHAIDSAYAVHERERFIHFRAEYAADKERRLGHKLQQAINRVRYSQVRRTWFHAGVPRAMAQISAAANNEAYREGDERQRFYYYGHQEPSPAAIVARLTGPNAPSLLPWPGLRRALKRYQRAVARRRRLEAKAGKRAMKYSRQFPIGSIERDLQYIAGAQALSSTLPARDWSMQLVMLSVFNDKALKITRADGSQASEYQRNSVLNMLSGEDPDSAMVPAPNETAPVRDLVDQAREEGVADLYEYAALLHERQSAHDAGDFKAKNRAGLKITMGPLRTRFNAFQQATNAAASTDASTWSGRRARDRALATAQRIRAEIVDRGGFIPQREEILGSIMRAPGSGAQRGQQGRMNSAAIARIDFSRYENGVGFEGHRDNAAPLSDAERAEGWTHAAEIVGEAYGVQVRLRELEGPIDEVTRDADYKLYDMDTGYLLDQTQRSGMSHATRSYIEQVAWRRLNGLGDDMDLMGPWHPDWDHGSWRDRHPLPYLQLIEAERWLAPSAEVSELPPMVDNQPVTMREELIDGSRLRTYTVGAYGNQSNIFVGETPDGGWAVLLTDIDGRTSGRLSDYLEEIELGLPARLSPKGMLTDEAYAYWLQAEPSRVQFHMRGGELFDNVWISPEVARYGSLVLPQLDGTVDQDSRRAALAAQLERIVAQMPPQAFAEMNAVDQFTDPGAKAVNSPNSDDDTTLFSIKSARTPSRSPALDEAGYHSAALEGAHAWPQKKGTPQQIREFLTKKALVREGELRAMNFDAFLEGKKSVTKDEVVAFMEANRIEMGEATKWGKAPERRRRYRAVEDMTREEAIERGRERAYESAMDRYSIEERVDDEAYGEAIEDEMAKFEIRKLYPEEENYHPHEDRWVILEHNKLVGYTDPQGDLFTGEFTREKIWESDLIENSDQQSYFAGEEEAQDALREEVESRIDPSDYERYYITTDGGDDISDFDSRSAAEEALTQYAQDDVDNESDDDILEYYMHDWVEAQEQREADEAANAEENDVQVQTVSEHGEPSWGRYTAKVPSRGDTGEGQINKTYHESVVYLRPSRREQAIVERLREIDAGVDLDAIRYPGSRPQVGDEDFAERIANGLIPTPEVEAQLEQVREALRVEARALRREQRIIKAGTFPPTHSFNKNNAVGFYLRTINEIASAAASSVVRALKSMHLHQVQADWAQRLRDARRDAWASKLFGPETEAGKAAVAEAREHLKAAEAEEEKLRDEALAFYGEIGRAPPSLTLLSHLRADLYKLDRDVGRARLEAAQESAFGLPAVLRVMRRVDTRDEFLLDLKNDGDAYRAITEKFPELGERDNWQEVVTAAVWPEDTSVERSVALNVRMGEVIDRRSQASMAVDIAEAPATFDKLTDAQREQVSKAIQEESNSGAERMLGAKDAAKIEELSAQIDKLELELADLDSATIALALDKGGVEVAEHIRQNHARWNYPRAIDPAAGVIHGLALDELPDLRDAPDRTKIVERHRFVLDELSRLRQELKTQEASLPSHPLVDTTDQWLRTTLRHAIRDAVRNGVDYISIPSGEYVLSYNPGKDRGMKGFYNDILPKALLRELRRMDGDIKPTRVGLFSASGVAFGTDSSKEASNALYWTRNQTGETDPTKVREEAAKLLEQAADLREKIDNEVPNAIAWLANNGVADPQKAFGFRDDDDYIMAAIERGMPAPSIWQEYMDSPGQTIGNMVKMGRAEQIRQIAQELRDGPEVKFTAFPITDKVRKKAPEMALFAIKKGGNNNADPAAPEAEPKDKTVRGIADIVADLKAGLGMPTTVGRYQLTITDRAGGRQWRLNPWKRQPKSNTSVAGGQYFDDAARLRIGTDIDGIAETGGRHLLNTMKTGLSNFLQTWAEELTEKPAANGPAPALSRQGFSGLELDADTQNTLVRAASAFRRWRALSTMATAAPVDSVREAGLDAAVAIRKLSRRLGANTAKMLLDDIVGNPAAPNNGIVGQSSSRNMGGNTGNNTGSNTGSAGSTAAAVWVGDMDPAAVAGYVATRYSATGTAKPRSAQTPTPVEVESAFVDFFGRVITESETVRRDMPGAYTAFRELLSGHAPGLLQDIDGLKNFIAGEQYKLYREATAWERAVADSGTMREPTTWGRIARWWKSRSPDDTMRQWFNHIGAMASYAVTDKSHPILKTVQSILKMADAAGVRDVNGKPITLKVRQNAYKIARMMAGAHGIGHAYIMRGVPDYNGVAPVGPSLHAALTLAMGGKGRGQWSDKAMAEFGTYLEARRAIAEWPRFASGEIPAQPTRRSLEENIAIVSQAEAARPQYKQAAQMVYDWNTRLLTLEFQAGKWSKEAYAELLKKKDYVPFRREIDVEPPNPIDTSSFAKIASRFTGSKRFKGHDSDIINPIEAMVQRAYHTAGAIQFNDMVKALADLSDRVPGAAKFVERVNKEEVLATNSATFDKLKQEAIALGMDPVDAQQIIQEAEQNFTDTQVQALFSPVDLGVKRPPMLPLWENGERNIVRFNDPVMGKYLFDAMNAVGRPVSTFLNHWLVNRMFVRPASILRAGVTMHPAFVLSNIFGDMVASWVRTGALPVVTQMRGLYHLLSTNPTVAAALNSVGATRMGRALGIKASDIADMYTHVGGISGGQNMAALRAVSQNYELGELRRDGFRLFDARAIGGFAAVMSGIAAGGVLAGPVGATVGGIVGAMGGRAALGKGAETVFAQLTELSETVTRLGVAAHAMKRAKQIDPNISDTDAIREAAFTARNVLDFDRGGALMGPLLKLIPFMNANIQGVSAAYRQGLLLDGERGRINLAKVGLFLNSYLSNAAASRLEQEVSAADIEAIKQGGRMWVFMSILAAVSIAMMLLNWDDDEIRNAPDEMKRQHWLFRLPGYGLVRVKKPFELATLANMGESFMDWLYGRDPRLVRNIASGIYDTHVPPLYPAFETLRTGFRTGVDPKTGREINPPGTGRRSPQNRYNAYASQFAIEWSKALNKVGIPISPAQIDWTLSTEIAYWGREVKVSSDYFFGHRAAKTTDVPLLGTVVNRFAYDPSRQSQSVQTFWEQMGHGKGKFDQAAADYDFHLQSGNARAASAFLAGLEQNERLFAVLQKHGTPEERRSHPLNRAGNVMRITSQMRRELAEKDGLINTEAGESRGRPIEMRPEERTLVEDALGRLNAVVAWNALARTGVYAWSQRNARDEQSILDELSRISPAAYAEMIHRWERDPRSRVRPFDQANDTWERAQERMGEIIRDEDLLGQQWSRSFERRRTPARRMEER